MRRIAIIAFGILATGCGTTKLYAPDLGGIYNEIVQAQDPYRNPVIVVPGILGSRLKDNASGEIVWGAFGPGTLNPKRPAISTGRRNTLAKSFGWCFEV